MTGARIKTAWLIATLLGFLAVFPADAKSYSSGSRSYSSGRSSSSSGGGSASRSSGSKSYSSGKSTYSSSSSSSSSGKSYSSGSTGASGGGSTVSHPDRDSSGSTTASPRSYSPPKSGSGSFDAAAAKARQKEESTRAYNNWKGTQTASSGGGGPPPSVPTTTSSSGGNWGGSRGYTSRTTTYYHYVPTYDDFTTHHVRVINYYGSYIGRPVVIYRDPYSSFFWWWLLDQSLDTRAQWAYNHRYDMDAARYNAMVADSELAARVKRLEDSQSQIDPNFVPNGMQRDLMYSDQYVHDAYRSTTNSHYLFWLLMIPVGGGVTVFAIWLVFFKKWNVN